MAKVGAYVLDSLTSGMYLNPLDSIREFVQNSSDAIRRAENCGLLNAGAGRIEIKIDPQKRTLNIRDNGIGVNSEECYARLIDIGMSNKDIERDAGFRGIGRLAGIAYCTKLIFKTKCNSEKKGSVIEINCEALKKAMSPAMKEVEELNDVMDKFSKVMPDETCEKGHYFEVVLEGITETANSFLDWKILEEYLSQVAPVEFDSHRFTNATEINKWLKKNNIYLPTVTMVLKTPETERQIFKPYKTKYRTKKDTYDLDVKHVLFYPEEINSETPFWIWYGETDLLGTIDDPKSAGFRFRKHNIELGGPDRVAELFARTTESNRRFNNYYIGEIHVLSKKAVPNGRRDGFEENNDWLNIVKEIMPFVEFCCSEIRQNSDERNRNTRKVVNLANNTIKVTQERLKDGLISARERDELLEKVTKEEQRINKAMESRKKDELKEVLPVAEAIKSIKDKLENEKNLIKFNPSLDKKQRNTILDILEILYDTLDKAEYIKARQAILSKYQVEESEAFK